MNSRYIIASPDELYHFKYIKRIKGPDGKYRYYYGDKATHKAIQTQFRDASKLYRESDKLNKKASKAIAVARKNSTGWNAKVYSTKVPTIVKKNAIAFVQNTDAARKARSTADKIVSSNDYYTVGQTAKRNLSAVRDNVSRKVKLARGSMQSKAFLAKRRLKNRFASIHNKFKRKR